jgi:hypothetical protein
VADKKAFLLRISPELYEQLARWARDDLRSLNGQIEFLLRGALSDAGRLTEGRDAGPRSGHGEEA